MDESIKNAGNLIGKTLFSGAANYAYNRAIMSAQEKAQIRAEQRQTSEWWRRFKAQNEYQDPSAMADRIRKAGGNPLSVFAQGYSPNPANPQLGGLSSPSISNQTIVDPLTASQINLNDAHAEKLRSDVDVNKSDIALNSAYEKFVNQQTLSEEQLTRLRTIEADIQEATKGTQISTYVAALDRMLAEVKNIDQNSEYYRQLSYQVEVARAVEQYKLDNILPAELANIQADTNLIVANTELSEQEAQRLRDLTAKDKHELYLEYQKVAQEYPLLTNQNNLSEKDFDSIITDFVSYAHNSGYYGNSYREREVSAQETSANASSTNASVNLGTAAGMALSIALATFGGGKLKGIGEKLIKSSTQRTIVK